MHITSLMRTTLFQFSDSKPIVVGSFGDLESLSSATPEALGRECEIAEVRLDLFHREFAEMGRALWEHLIPFPLLFTARRKTEGSPFDLDSGERSALLGAALADASIIDIEVASMSEMPELIGKIRSDGISWIASYHDFDKLPGREMLEAQSALAKGAGASAFKFAGRLKSPDDLVALVKFQMSDQGIPLSTMGMGDLAPVSRLLCAQAGSVLNYGFVGTQETAPGQWSASQLREGILSLKPISAIS